MQGAAFFDVRTGELEFDPSDATVALQRVDTCPNCGAEDDHFRTMQLSDGLVLPVVAETLLAALPVMPAPQRGWLPAGGRRLLAFSDSRARAARLGPMLTRLGSCRMPDVETGAVNTWVDDHCFIKRYCLVPVSRLFAKSGF
jgi:hypothetical protein